MKAHFANGSLGITQPARAGRPCGCGRLRLRRFTAREMSCTRAQECQTGYCARWHGPRRKSGTRFGVLALGSGVPVVVQDLRQVSIPFFQGDSRPFEKKSKVQPAFVGPGRGKSLKSKVRTRGELNRGSSHPEATLRLSGGQPVGTLKPASGYPEATLKLPLGYPGAIPSPNFAYGHKIAHLATKY
jgi:hypothetical protein